MPVRAGARRGLSRDCHQPIRPSHPAEADRGKNRREASAGETEGKQTELLRTQAARAERTKAAARQTTQASAAKHAAAKHAAANALSRAQAHDDPAGGRADLRAVASAALRRLTTVLAAM